MDRDGTARQTLAATGRQRQLAEAAARRSDIGGRNCLAKQPCRRNGKKIAAYLEAGAAEIRIIFPQTRSLTVVRKEVTIRSLGGYYGGLIGVTITTDFLAPQALPTFPVQPNSTPGWFGPMALENESPHPAKYFELSLKQENRSVDFIQVSWSPWSNGHCLR